MYLALPSRHDVHHRMLCLAEPYPMVRVRFLVRQAKTSHGGQILPFSMNLWALWVQEYINQNLKIHILQSNTVALLVPPRCISAIHITTVQHCTPLSSDYSTIERSPLSTAVTMLLQCCNYCLCCDSTVQKL